MEINLCLKKIVIGRTNFEIIHDMSFFKYVNCFLLCELTKDLKQELGHLVLVFYFK